MKWNKVMALGLAAVMCASLTACGGGSESSESTSGSAVTGSDASEASEASGEGAGTEGPVTYADITLGEDYTDLEADIKLLTNRTDMLDSEYAGVSWQEYLDRFHETYPGISVEIEGITDYAQDSLLRLQGGDWGDVMMIPDGIDKSDLSTYFLSYGDRESV